MIIYRAEHIQSGRSYIGATTRSLRRRQSEHACNSRARRSPFALAVRREGVDAFLWSILATCESHDELMAAERAFIAKFDTTNPARGYNLAKGGLGTPGVVASAETIERRRRAQTGLRRSPEVVEAMRARMKGKAPSQACIEASVASEKHREAARENGRRNRGRKLPPLSDEGRAKRSAQRRAMLAEGRACKLFPPRDLPIILEMRAGGATLKDIGAHLGVHACTVFYFLKRSAA